MPPVLILRPQEVVKAFEKFGLEVVRQRGSHIILTKEGHIATLSVPKHSEGSPWNVAKFDCTRRINRR